VDAFRQQAAVAEELLAASERFWGMQPWADSDGALTCLGHHSLRGLDASFDRRLAITAALGGYRDR
jgi:hypothetical protein